VTDTDFGRPVPFSESTPANGAVRDRVLFAERINAGKAKRGNVVTDASVVSALKRAARALEDAVGKATDAKPLSTSEGREVIRKCVGELRERLDAIDRAIQICRGEPAPIQTVRGGELVAV
jgi:hypothetical protein